MTELKQVYKCSVCGNIVEMLHTGAGGLVCCGQPMELQVANTVDAAQEKHVPVIEKTDNGVKVKIGSEPHPMTEEHHIEWIEVIVDGHSCMQFLEPTGQPEAEFCLTGEKIETRAYCNLHGLWKA
ncbi:MAG: desulfoferrodoxin [Patescibacteria group bacterium]